MKKHVIVLPDLHFTCLATHLSVAVQDCAAVLLELQPKRQAVHH